MTQKMTRNQTNLIKNLINDVCFETRRTFFYLFNCWIIACVFIGERALMLVLFCGRRRRLVYLQLIVWIAEIDNVRQRVGYLCKAARALNSHGAS